MHDINVQKERFDEFGKALTAEIYTAVDKATVRHNRQQRAPIARAQTMATGIGHGLTEGASCNTHQSSEGPNHRAEDDHEENEEAPLHPELRRWLDHGIQPAFMTQ